MKATGDLKAVLKIIKENVDKLYTLQCNESWMYKRNEYW
jgi:hypothetical protein